MEREKASRTDLLNIVANLVVFTAILMAVIAT